MKRGAPKPMPARSPEQVERLVEDNMPLAFYFTKKYANFYPDEGHLLSEAMRGLHRAAETWDEATGVSFGTYASLRINWLYRRVFKPPRLQRRGTEAVVLSLDAEMDGDWRWHETVADPHAASDYNADMWELVEAAVAELPEVEQVVVRMRFGIDGRDEHTLDQVARQLEVTRERTRQIEAKALARLACLVKGLPFRWDCKAHRCHALAGSHPVSAMSAKDRSRKPELKKLRKSR